MCIQTIILMLVYRLGSPQVKSELVVVYKKTLCESCLTGLIHDLKKLENTIKISKLGGATLLRANFFSRKRFLALVIKT